jgi:hypothetical protein
MKTGDMVKFHDSRRRNGKLAGKVGLVIALDAYNHPIIIIAGMTKAYHSTQIERVIKDDQ